MAFAPEGLAIWLDERFMQNSTQVTRILSAGIFFTCLGQIPYAFIQGAGRPDLTGKLHLIEFPPYIVLLAVSINLAGITGAAVIWTLRFVIDTIVMYLIAQKLLGTYRLKTKKKVLVFVFSLASIAVSAILQPFHWRAIASLMVTAIFFWAAFRYFLSAEEKDFIKQAFRLYPKQGKNDRT